MENSNFDNENMLELLLFTEKRLFDVSLRYSIRHNIPHLIWPSPDDTCHSEGLLMDMKNAIIFKPTYDRFKNLKTDLLT